MSPCQRKGTLVTIRESNISVHSLSSNPHGRGMFDGDCHTCSEYQCILLGSSKENRSCCENIVSLCSVNTNVRTISNVIYQDLNSIP
jgi:hypothetical protein